MRPLNQIGTETFEAGQPRPANRRAACRVAGGLRRRWPPAARGHPAGGRALACIEQLYQTHEVTHGQPLDPAAVAQAVGVSEHYVRGTLTALRGGTLPAVQRIEQLWRLWEAQAASGSRSPTWPASLASVKAGSARCWDRCAPPPHHHHHRSGAAADGGRGRRPASPAGPGRLPRPGPQAVLPPSPASSESARGQGHLRLMSGPRPLPRPRGHGRRRHRRATEVSPAAPSPTSAADSEVTRSRSRAPTGSSASWPSRAASSLTRSGCGRPSASSASTAAPSKLPSSSGNSLRWSAGWGGCPAASSPPAPRPNAPSSWPSSGAQRQRGRGRAGDDLAVAAQGLPAA